MHCSSYLAQPLRSESEARAALTHPAPVTISLTITTTDLIGIDAADALCFDLTQAANQYLFRPEPDYRLAQGAVLFGRDWLEDGRQVTSWAREGLDAAQVARVADVLMRTWAVIAEEYVPGCQVEFGDALAIGRATADQVAA